jgi:hypothetical protein
VHGMNEKCRSLCGKESNSNITISYLCNLRSMFKSLLVHPKRYLDVKQLTLEIVAEVYSWMLSWEVDLTSPFHRHDDPTRTLRPAVKESIVFKILTEVRTNSSST